MDSSSTDSRPRDENVWRILVIDDDEDDFILVQDMLANARHGRFKLEWSQTYEQGWQMLQADRTFDAVLVDHLLGRDKGTELIRAAVAAEYPAPLLLLTGRGTYEIDMEAMQAGAADFLAKDEINPAILERAIRYAIEREKHEAALRASEEMLASAFHSSPTGLTITRRADGLILDANQAFLQMVEYNRDEVIGRTSVDLRFHQSAESRAEIMRRLKEEGGVRNFEIQVPAKSGRFLTVLYSIEAVEIGGQPCALSTFLDITERRRLEAERIIATAEVEVQRRLLEQREKERQGIARELHDGPIQSLASTTFHLQLIKEAFPDPALVAELNQVSLNIKFSIRELRDLLNDLRPPALMHFGLAKVIQMYNMDIHERYPELDISLDVIDEGLPLPDQTCLALFRIYQESLNNITRHSGATKVRVVFHLKNDHFNLELHDNGRGFENSHDLSKLTRDGHFGLAGMKERAEAVGGELTIRSGPGQGTVIRVCGPLDPQR